MKRMICVIMMSLAVVVCTDPEGYALHTDTHEFINEYIATPGFTGFNLHQHLKDNLGFLKGVNQRLEGTPYWWLPVAMKMPVIDWVKKGGTYEDSPPVFSALPYLRCFNHFHDPLVADLAEAGLGPGNDAIVWAHLPKGRQGFSWHDARDAYFNALITEDAYERSILFSSAFRGLGQLMHLVTDMSVPEHVRADVHMMGSVPGISLVYSDYESHLKKKGGDFPLLLDAVSSSIAFPQLLSDSTPLNETMLEEVVIMKPLVNLIDNDVFGGLNPEDTLKGKIGISEYTNANFLSPDTMFRHYAFPSIDECEIVLHESRKYLKITQEALGEKVDPLAVVSYLYFWRTCYYPHAQEDLPVGLDSACYEEYARHLIPRAVGYSSKVLNYFFRGRVEISLPDDGVYAFTDTLPQDPSREGFTSIRLKARNVSEDGEEMSGGSIHLVVQYSVMSRDPFRNYTPYPMENNEVRYCVVPLDDCTDHVIPADDARELEFDLSGHPIPLWATDVYLFVVYRGRLGSEDGYIEEDAVAVGFKDISEPSLFDVVNATDYASIEGVCLYVGDDQGLALAQDLLGMDSPEGITPSTFFDIFIRFSSIDAPQDASPAMGSHLYVVPVVEPGTYTRAYLLSDYEFAFSFYSLSSSYQYRTSACSGMRNQVHYDETHDVFIRRHSSLDEFRGVGFWNRVNFMQYQHCSQDYLEEHDGTCARCDMAEISDPWPLEEL